MMALEEQQVLRSLEIILEPMAVNICWMDLILRDGVVIQSTPHRGSYDLKNGEIPESVADEFGITLNGLLGEVGQSLLAQNQNLMNHADSLVEELAQLKQALMVATDELNKRDNEELVRGESEA